MSRCGKNFSEMNALQNTISYVSSLQGNRNVLFRFKLLFLSHRSGSEADAEAPQRERSGRGDYLSKRANTCSTINPSALWLITSPPVYRLNACCSFVAILSTASWHTAKRCGNVLCENALWGNPPGAETLDAGAWQNRSQLPCYRYRCEVDAWLIRRRNPSVTRIASPDRRRPTPVIIKFFIIMNNIGINVNTINIFNQLKHRRVSWFESASSVRDSSFPKSCDVISTPARPGCACALRRLATGHNMKSIFVIFVYYGKM